MKKPQVKVYHSDTSNGVMFAVPLDMESELGFCRSMYPYGDDWEFSPGGRAWLVKQDAKCSLCGSEIDEDDGGWMRECNESKEPLGITYYHRDCVEWTLMPESQGSQLSEIEELIHRIKTIYAESLDDIKEAVDKDLDVIEQVLRQLLPLEKLKIPERLPGFELRLTLTLPNGEQSVMTFEIGSHLKS